MAESAAANLTEADVLGMLRAKLTRPGNGGSGEYAFLTHVRNRAGFDATRTIDAVAVSLWPSRGFSIEGYEVKCSRSDWLRELNDPAKAEAAAEFCDRFSIVAANAGVVAAGELPPTWGLLVVRGDTLRTMVKAPLLPGADVSRPLPRTVLVPMLRAAGSALVTAPAEIKAARDAAKAEADRRLKAVLERRDREVAELVGAVKAFEEAAGVSLGRWGGRWGDDPAKVGAAVKTVLSAEGAEERARGHLLNVRRQLSEALEAIDEVVDG